MASGAGTEIDPGRVNGTRPSFPPSTGNTASTIPHPQESRPWIIFP